MSDPIKDKLGRWSLKRIEFLLAHVEDFIENEDQDLRERARQFVVQTDLNTIENLVEAEPNDPFLPQLALDRLSAFFEAGLLLQRGLSPENANWWITDLFWRGTSFHLDLKDQIRCNGLVPEITPLQVHRANAARVLTPLNLNFLVRKPEMPCFIVKPTPNIAYLLLSDLAEPWLVDHMAQAHKLISKCFVY